MSMRALATAHGIAYVQFTLHTYMSRVLGPRIAPLMGSSASCVRCNPTALQNAQAGTSSANPAPMAQSMLFRQLFDAESSTFTYLLADLESKEALLIDPVLEQVKRDAQLIQDLGLNLKLAINTHVHADHVTGTGELKKRLPGLKSGLAAAAGAKADVLFEPYETFGIGKHSFKVLPTPGHTVGCVSYHTHSNGGMVFTGDAVLIRGCGRTDFQGGSAEVLYDNVHKEIFSLPPATLIYPAHDYKGHTCSSVSEEARLNPRLTKSKDEFVDIMQNLNLPYPKKIDAALPLNLVCGIQD